MSFIPLAVYMAWWMPPWHAAVGATLGCAMLYGAFAVSGQFPDLLVPWLTVTATALGLGAGFAMLVSQLRAHVLVDPLTGLLNREGMNAILGSVPRSASDRPARDLVVIDLDGFKAVNDRDGHLAGDEMLRDFAMAVRHAVRPGDFAFRSGGDEFVLVLVVADSGGTAAVLDRLRGSSPLAWSSGATSWAPGEPFDAAFARADALMYDAKPRRS
jgi:diguanylate cyclase (GGDEF)-like protein